MNDTRYFSLTTGADSTLYGLLRYQEDDNGLTLARFDKEGKKWVTDPKLFDHFYEGGTDLQRITPEKAASIASSWGGSI